MDFAYYAFILIVLAAALLLCWTAYEVGKKEGYATGKAETSLKMNHELIAISNDFNKNMEIVIKAMEESNKIENKMYRMTRRFYEGGEKDD